MARKKKGSNSNRPVAVTITALVIAVLFFIRIYQTVKPLIQEDFFTYRFTPPLILNGTLTTYGRAVLESGLYLLLAVALIILFIGFLRMKRWSWVFLICWVGFSMLVSLVDYFYFHQPNYLIMGSDMVIAYALNQSDVQRIFGIRSDTGENIL